MGVYSSIGLEVHVYKLPVILGEMIWGGFEIAVSVYAFGNGTAVLSEAVYEWAVLMH